MTDRRTTDRRTFLKLSALGGASVGSLAAALGAGAAPARAGAPRVGGPAEGPVVVSTWRFGQAANAEAWAVLSEGGGALDAVEAGARVPEADPENATVGIGGYPDRSGQVTLDACIMNPQGGAGSVAALPYVMHPVSVARRVMEATPHVMLVGKGAFDFAMAQGFTAQSLLTDDARQAWLEWRASEEQHMRPEINVEDASPDEEPRGGGLRGGEKNHDTLGILALDAGGDLAGACTTSGAAWKLPGRVGDSPLIGAGLYVDNAVGAACATGWGEAVIRVVGSHLVVELMRQGRGPQEACCLAVERVIEKNPDYEEIQVGFLALGRDGTFGAYSVQPGFTYAAYDEPEGSRVLDAESRLAP